MNARLARVLVRLYPRGWRRRYGAEFEAMLEDAPGGIGTMIDVMGSALGERVLPTTGGEMVLGTSRIERLSLRAPWAMFWLAPVGLLAAAYGVALLLLSSGWRMFLPYERTPFVRVDGWGVAYFGVARFLYFWAPMLVGIAIAWMAARPGVRALWPVVGMLLIAWIGGAVQVQVSRPTLNEPGHVGMFLAMGRLGYAPEVLAVSVLVYVLLRVQRRREKAA